MFGKGTPAQQSRVFPEPLLLSSGPNDSRCYHRTQVILCSAQTHLVRAGEFRWQPQLAAWRVLKTASWPSDLLERMQGTGLIVLKSALLSPLLFGVVIGLHFKIIRRY